ncbi:MAG: PKD domain-containing protein [Gammaproteobacteria bacterium]|nr:PKD domain-containing protein [Gammaproteobacteria bacterium]
MTSSFCVHRRIAASRKLITNAVTLIIAILPSLFLTSCGGGGGGDGARQTPPPVVTDLKVSDDKPFALSSVTFSARCTGEGLSYTWDFGDGEKTPAKEISPGSDAVSAEHFYEHEGPKQISVTCIDSFHQQTSLAVTVNVQPARVGDMSHLACSGERGRGWCVQNPLPTATNFASVAIVKPAIVGSEPQTIWAVGTNKAIVKTTDGGRNWRVQKSGTSHDVTSIAAVDTNTAWATGNNYNSSVILKTIDGSTWIPQPLPLPAEPNLKLHSISAVDKETAWAVGESDSGVVVLRTINGGPWESKISNTQGTLYSVAAVDANTAWAVGSDGQDRLILKTEDGGKSWASLSLGRFDGITSDLSSIVAVSANTAWAVGSVGEYGALYITSNTAPDGTITFHPQGGSTGKSLTSIAAINANTALAVGYGWNGAPAPIVKITINSNNVLGIQDATTSEVGTDSLSAIAVYSSAIWVAGKDSTILKATDDGSNAFIWEHKNSGSSKGLNSVAAVDLNTVWAVGDYGTILKTPNGNAWVPQKAEQLDKSSKNSAVSVAVVDASTAWVLAWDGKILKTTDGGTTWISTSMPELPLRAITAVDANTAWAVSRKLLSPGVYASAVFKITTTTVNGIATFALEEKIIGTDPLVAIAVVDAKTIWAMGYGTIFKTQNGDQNLENQKWESKAIEVTEGVPFSGMYSMAAIDKDTVLGVGSDGTIVKIVTTTTSTGIQFKIDGKSLEKNYTLKSIAVAKNANSDVSGIVAWAVGSHWVNGTDVIFKTEDGGAIWVRQDPGTASSLTSVTAVDKDTAWAVGAGGLILKTVTGGYQ